MLYIPSNMYEHIIYEWVEMERWCWADGARWWYRRRSRRWRWRQLWRNRRRMRRNTFVMRNWKKNKKKWNEMNIGNTCDQKIIMKNERDISKFYFIYFYPYILFYSLPISNSPFYFNVSPDLTFLITIPILIPIPSIIVFWVCADILKKFHLEISFCSCSQLLTEFLWGNEWSIKKLHNYHWNSFNY